MRLARQRVWFISRRGGLWPTHCLQELQIPSTIERMDNANTIGTKIKQTREQRDISVERLAELSSVSAQMIEQLEAGSLAPSLAPLLKIARALGVRLGTFLDDAPGQGPVMVTGGKSDKIIRFSGNKTASDSSSLDFFSLAAEKKDRHMEPFVITVRPGEEKELNLSEHEGEEFIYVLDGSIRVHYGKEIYNLNASDSIYYDSVVPHYVHTVGSEEARILAVIYTPM